MLAVQAITAEESTEIEFREISLICYNVISNEVTDFLLIFLNIFFRKYPLVYKHAFISSARHVHD